MEDETLMQRMRPAAAKSWFALGALLFVTAVLGVTTEFGCVRLETSEGGTLVVNVAAILLFAWLGIGLVLISRALLKGKSAEDAPAE